MFGMKKKDGDVPPDVGAEEEYDASKGVGAESTAGKSDSKISGANDKIPEGIASASSVPVVAKGVPSSAPAANFELEKLSSRVDAITEWIKQFYDRFSYVSESIGELRSVGLANEKNIAKSIAEAEKVIDVVKEVKPQDLRMDYQKIDLKISTLTEKIAANNQFMEELMKEMNDLRRESEVFVGTEGLMKLNEDTKKDLVEIQKVNSKVKMQADKSQEIFMELRKGFAESQKVGAVVENLDDSYSGLKEQIERLRLDYSKVIGQKEYTDFKKTYGNKLASFDGVVADMQALKDNVNQLGGLVETSLSVSRENKEDVGKIALKEGVDDVKSVEEYQNQVADMVDIIEKLTGEIAAIKKEVGMKPKTAVVNNPIGEVVRKPSDNEGVREAVGAVKVADVPVLKPEKFLGKKKLITKRVDNSLEKAKEGKKKKEPVKVKKVIKKKEPVKKGVKKSVKKEKAPMGEVADDVESSKDDDGLLFDV